jgi:hypothetical protein
MPAATARRPPKPSSSMLQAMMDEVLKGSNGVVVPVKKRPAVVPKPKKRKAPALQPMAPVNAETVDESDKSDKSDKSEESDDSERSDRSDEAANTQPVVDDDEASDDEVRVLNSGPEDDSDESDDSDEEEEVKAGDGALGEDAGAAAEAAPPIPPARWSLWKYRMEGEFVNKDMQLFFKQQPALQCQADTKYSHCFGVDMPTPFLKK